VEEILEWDQEDLDPGHLNILDTSSQVFLWTGQRANIEEEKKLAMETVLDYSKLHPKRKELDITSDVLCVNGRRYLSSYLFCLTVGESFLSYCWGIFSVFLLGNLFCLPVGEAANFEEKKIAMETVRRGRSLE
jgi:hypothetical protein